MDCYRLVLWTRGRLRARKRGGAVTEEVAGIAGTSTPICCYFCEQLESDFLQRTSATAEGRGLSSPALAYFVIPANAGIHFDFCLIKNGSRVSSHIHVLHGVSASCTHLFQLDLGTGRFEILLHLLGVFLAGAFLDGLRRAFHQVL